MFTNLNIMVLPRRDRNFSIGASPAKITLLPYAWEYAMSSRLTARCRSLVCAAFHSNVPHLISCRVPTIAQQISGSDDPGSAMRCYPTNKVKGAAPRVKLVWKKIFPITSLFSGKKNGRHTKCFDKTIGSVHLKCRGIMGLQMDRRAFVRTPLF